MILTIAVILALVAIACWAGRGPSNGSEARHDSWTKYGNGG